MRHFQRTNGMLKLIAVALLMVLVIPQYVQASSRTEIITNTVSVDSANEGTYDETVNIATDASVTNPSTWNPSYQGVWVGGSTEESLFRFNEWTTPDYFSLPSVDGSGVMESTTEFEFSSHQIMSGASEWVVRLPNYVDVTEIWDLWLRVYEIPSSNCYNFTPQAEALMTLESWIGLVFDAPSAVHLLYSLRLDLTDVNPMDGNDIYTLDHRTYVTIRAPIIPGHIYLFETVAQYEPNEQFKIYLSANDIASDGIYNSFVNRLTMSAPDAYQYNEKNLTLDLGWSFDFRVGLGGGYSGQEIYLAAGHELAFWTYCHDGGSTDGYHSIMIPFSKDNDTARFSVRVYKSSDLGTAFWTSAAYTYVGYILAHTVVNKDAGLTGFAGDFFFVVIRPEWTMRIRFITDDLNPSGPLFWFDAMTGCVWNETQQFFVYNGTVGSGPWDFRSNMHLVNSYLISYTMPSAPDVLVGGKPLNNRLFYIRQAMIDRLTAIIELIPFAGAGKVILSMLEDIGGRLRQVVSGLYGGISGIPVVSWLVEHAREFMIGAATLIWGVMRNLMDFAMGVLQGIGNFVRAVGEFIYTALTWLVDSILEYGSILLGLLIVGVGLLIFFYPIHYQVKLWTAGLLMAQGKFTQADRELSGVAKDINRTGRKGLRLFTKVGRRLK